MAEASVGQHDAELTGQQKLGWCLDNIGQRLTTAGLGQTDARVVRTMAVAENGLPEPVDAQVSLLYDAAKPVADRYGDVTMRGFLRSSNPYAGDRSLLGFTAMAGTDPETARQVVEGAVKKFLN